MKQLAVVLAIKCGHFNALNNRETQTMDDHREIDRLRGEIEALAKEHFVPDSKVDIRSSGLSGLSINTLAKSGAGFTFIVRPTFVGPETEVVIQRTSITADLGERIRIAADMTQAITKMIEA